MSDSTLATCPICNGSISTNDDDYVGADGDFAHGSCVRDAVAFIERNDIDVDDLFLKRLRHHRHRRRAARF